MKRVLPSLLWKEWREQRWMFGFGCLMLASVMLIGLRARMAADEALLTGACVVSLLLLPLLAAGTLVPAGRADGTLRALLALPVRPRQVLAAKAVAGVVLCVGPLAAAAAVTLVVAEGREMSAGAVAWLCARAAAAAVSLFLWMFAVTVRQPTEPQAWMLSVGVLIGWGCVVVGISSTSVPFWARYTCPFIWLAIDEPRMFGYARGGLDAALVQAALAVGLWLGAAALFRRSAEDRP